MLDMQFPIKYHDKNILWTQDNQSWAFYEITGFEYHFLSDNKKARISGRLETLFAQVEVDTHLLVLPKFSSVREIHEQFKDTITGPLKEEAIRHTEEVAPIVEKLVGSEASDYHFYFGVKLPKTEEERTLTFKNILEGFKDIFNQIFATMGLEDIDIPESQIDRMGKSEEQYFKIINGNIQTINSNIEARRIDENDYQWLIRRNFYRGIGIPPHVEGYKPQYRKTKKGRQPMDILRLTEGTVDAKTAPRKILLNQVVDGELKTGHCAFLTVSYIPTDGFSPIGTEWIYQIQALDFPVDTSIRVNSMDHRKVMGMVRNKKKELDDQEQHAAKSNNATTFEVAENLDLVNELEAFTNVTKMPQLYVSIVFGVSAANNEELKSRIRSVKDLYAEYKIQLEQPITDQFKLFNEFIPGGERYVSSYVQMMEPAALASGMFGATNQIGDPNGFCIGTTGGDKRAVYMNPMLYTQGEDGTKSSSLSMIFVGNKGFGKSYAGNLIAYLSGLSGAKTFFIDPKGDRSKWNETLQEIRHQVNIITLEATRGNKGRLDPFVICRDIKNAEKLALKIFEYLAKINPAKDWEKWIEITNAVRDVAEGQNPCMDKVILKLLAGAKGSTGYQLGRYLATYQDLSFASLLFGDGSPVDALDIENAMNVLQIQNLKIPKKNKKSEDFDMEEMLSMAMMFPIGEFAHDFIKYDASVMKIVFIDESWFMEKTDIGKDIIDRLLREGRARNAGVFRATQAISDIDDETKSMIGMKFIFQNLDPVEAADSLKFLGIEPTEDLIETVQNLRKGQCFMQDIYGRTGLVQIRPWFKDLDRAFDTRPPIHKKPEQPKTDVRELATV